MFTIRVYLCIIGFYVFVTINPFTMPLKGEPVSNIANTGPGNKSLYYEFDLSTT